MVLVIDLQTEIRVDGWYYMIFRRGIMEKLNSRHRRDKALSL